MYCLFLSLILSLSMIISPLEASAKEAARKTPYTQVTPEQLNYLINYSAFKNQIHVQKVLLSQVDDTIPAPVLKKPEMKTESDKSEENSKPKPTPVLDLSAMSGSSGNAEAAMVVFAVVGLFVVFAWIPYLPIMAYEAATSGKGNIQYYHLIGAQYTSLGGSFNSLVSEVEKESPKNGAFAGLRYSLLMEKITDPGLVKLGVTTEAGHYDFLKKGGYWLVGPSIVLGDLDPGSLYGKVDLLAGSSFNADLGLVSKADLSLNWLFKTGITLGVNAGALYLDVNDNRGIASSKNRLGLVYGGNLGYAF